MRTITSENIVESTDSYKFGHPDLYPAGMSFMLDYFTSRGGKHPFVMMFGLQFILIHILSKRVSVQDVEEARELAAQHFGTDENFPYEGWMRIATVHQGKLPIRIRAVPEGRLISAKAPLYTVESLDPEVKWIVSWVEGILQKVWFPTTIATEDFFTKIEMYKRLLISSDNPLAVLAFMLHDFGYRGTSSEESARIGGAAALVNFMGTDTFPALRFLIDYYHAKGAAGFSVVATEHSTTTITGRDGETEFVRSVIRKKGHQNILSFVGDSYNIYNFVDNIIGKALLAEVKAMNAKIVVRPDSSSPDHPMIDQIIYILNSLANSLGYTVNSKGYKVLNKAAVLQGDGIDHDGAIPEILDAVLAAGFSAENMVFGMGGGRLQKHDRDKQKCAIKCSMAIVDGEIVMVEKDPVTDPGKHSAKGYVDTIEGFFGPHLVDGLTAPDPRSIMRIVYEYGDVLLEDDFDTIRARANREFEQFTTMEKAA